MATEGRRDEGRRAQRCARTASDMPAAAALSASASDTSFFASMPSPASSASWILGPSPELARKAVQSDSKPSEKTREGA